MDQWMLFLLSCYITSTFGSHSPYSPFNHFYRNQIKPESEFIPRNISTNINHHRRSHGYDETYHSSNHGGNDYNQYQPIEDDHVTFVPNHEIQNPSNWTTYATGFGKQDIPFKPGRRLANADEAEMVTPEIIQKYDYPVEVYTVVTKDGYVLGVHRIPHGRNGYRQCRRRPVVFMMPDLISSSSDWIIQGPDRSLGYLLADAGYDVWLGNPRGNRYSRNHINFSPVSAKFWDFTFDQFGRHDLPAMIDFTLTMTEQDQLYYIGHSQGSVNYLTMLALHPEYNQKIRAGFLLSPVCYLTKMYSPILKFFSYFVNFIGIFFDVIGVHEFLPNSKLMSYFGQIMCKDQDPAQFVCTSVLFMLAGFNMKNLNATQLPIYMGHTPSGASTKTFIHYGQTSVSGVFREFDLGMIENFATYMASAPPAYSLKNVQTPTILFWGANDWFTHEQDVKRLEAELNNVQLITVADPMFSHIDFTFGMNAKEMVYDQLMDMMKYY